MGRQIAGRRQPCQMAASSQAIRIQRSRRGNRCSPQALDGYHHGDCFVSFQALNVRSKARKIRLAWPAGIAAHIHHAWTKWCGACRTAAT